MNNKFLYVRVSSEGDGEQNIDRQMNNVGQYKKVYIDRKSGRNAERPQLQAMLERIEEGDIIECHSLDRLSRSIRDLLHLVELITVEKKATLTFIKENLTFSSDKTDPYQQLMMTMISAISELELALIRSRCDEGIAKAKKRGVYKKAHPTKLNPIQIQQIKDDRLANLTERELMNKYHISKPTLYRYLKK